MRIKQLSDPRNWVVAGGAAFLVVSALGAVLLFPGYRPRDFLVRRLESRIFELPGPEVVPHLRRMTELGHDGVAAVARLLASENPEIAEAAEVVLSEEIDRWRRLPIEESAPRAIRLASVLADLEIPSFPGSRRYTTDLGMRLLLWPAADAAQAEELVAHCERILIPRGRRETTKNPLGPLRHATGSPPGEATLPRR
jgi:hypothetical protein